MGDLFSKEFSYMAIRPLYNVTVFGIDKTIELELFDKGVPTRKTAEKRFNFDGGGAEVADRFFSEVSRRTDISRDTLENIVNRGMPNWFSSELYAVMVEELLKVAGVDVRDINGTGQMAELSALDSILVVPGTLGYTALIKAEKRLYDQGKERVVRSGGIAGELQSLALKAARKFAKDSPKLAYKLAFEYTRRTSRLVDFKMLENTSKRLVANLLYPLDKPASEFNIAYVANQLKYLSVLFDFYPSDVSVLGRLERDGNLVITYDVRYAHKRRSQAAEKTDAKDYHELKRSINLRDSIVELTDKWIRERLEKGKGKDTTTVIALRKGVLSFEEGDSGEGIRQQIERLNERAAALSSVLKDTRYLLEVSHSSTNSHFILGNSAGIRASLAKDGIDIERRLFFDTFSTVEQGKTDEAYQKMFEDDPLFRTRKVISYAQVGDSYHSLSEQIPGVNVYEFVRALDGKGSAAERIRDYLLEGITIQTAYFHTKRPDIRMRNAEFEKYILSGLSTISGEELPQGIRGSVNYIASKMEENSKVNFRDASLKNIMLDVRIISAGLGFDGRNRLLEDILDRSLSARDAAERVVKDTLRKIEEGKIAFEDVLQLMDYSILNYDFEKSDRLTLVSDDFVHINDFPLTSYSYPELIHRFGVHQFIIDEMSGLHEPLPAARNTVRTEYKRHKELRREPLIWDNNYMLNLGRIFRHARRVDRTYNKYIAHDLAERDQASLHFNIGFLRAHLGRLKNSLYCLIPICENKEAYQKVVDYIKNHEMGFLEKVSVEAKRCT